MEAGRRTLREAIATGERFYISALLPSCANCAHYTGQRGCRAFERIPDSIWADGHDHSTPVGGDQGIQFEQVRDELVDDRRRPGESIQ